MTKTFLGRVDYYGREVDAYREVYPNGMYKFILENQGEQVFSFTY